MKKNQPSLQFSLKTAVWRTSLFIFCILLAIGTSEASSQEAQKEIGVYEYVVQSAKGTFDEISTAIENGTVAAGWRVLAKVDAGVPAKCPYKARVFVLYDSSYAEQVMKANRKTGPFAVVNRVNLFEDENGTHVAVVNPQSINRTVLMDDQKYDSMSKDHLQALKKMINAAVQGSMTDKEYGQFREEGYISKTMGLMAGGSFDEKIKDEAVVPGDNWKEVAEKVRKGLSEPGPEWGMHLVYELELPEFETVIFGSTGTPMDSRSFSIVKAGGDESRKKLKCPGLAHAAAYPIEVVVAKDGDQVKVRVVDSMYRMKVYFEDAGNWAFMKNMDMPGSIQDELKKQFKTSLGLK